jgi:hypothetical protein
MTNLSDLPELLMAHQAREILGLSKDKYYALVEVRPEFVVAIPGSKCRKFRRSALIQILGAAALNRP